MNNSKAHSNKNPTTCKLAPLHYSQTVQVAYGFLYTFAKNYFTSCKCSLNITIIYYSIYFDKEQKQKVKAKEKN